MAQIRPAAGAPVINEACGAHMGLEALRLAHRGKLRRPEECVKTTASNFKSTLGLVQGAVERADIGVDEDRRALQYRQSLRRAYLRWSAAQKPRGVLHRLPGHYVPLDGEKRIRRVGVPAGRRIGLRKLCVA